MPPQFRFVPLRSSGDRLLPVFVHYSLDIIRFWQILAPYCINGEGKRISHKVLIFKSTGDWILTHILHNWSLTSEIGSYQFYFDEIFPLVSNVPKTGGDIS